MKKTLLAVVVFAALLSFTACSPTASEKEPDTSSASSSAVSKEESTGESSTQEGASTTALYGKISSIAGNELEFTLAKDPYADLAPEGDDGGEIPATAMVPATEAGTEGGGEAPKMQLEYTGETKSYTIPSGVKIAGPSGGELQLDALKKGSVLMILMENDRITQIAILE